MLPFGKLKSAVNGYESTVREVIAIRQRYSIKLPDAIILATAKISKCELISNNSKDFSGEIGVKSIPFIFFP
ncbi:MAG: PIN domain-containing protein [Cytophagales bacterium]|nr:MAG: PIN domain-containing protein [Cytophagales bacterium]